MGSSKGARCELVSGVDDPGERRALTWLLGSAAVFARGAEEGELVAEVVGACARAAGYARVLLRRSGSEPPEAAPVAPSRLELPVDDQGEALGTLVIELDEPGGFAERERALLAALAEDFGAALGVARRRSVESARRGTEEVAWQMQRAQQTQLADKLQAGQRLEAVGQLAGAVAHDFNNLLSVILSCCGFALEALGPDDPTSGDLLEIQRAGKRAAALTRQLLAFSRNQAPELRPVDLNAAVLGVDGMLRRLIGEDIRVVLDLAPEQPTVKADLGQLEQVLLNLVVNARDAMPRGGTLRVATSTEPPDPARSRLRAGNYACLVVADDGVGMSATTLERIFEPFFTTKAPGRGTGLGLATVQGIVKHAGGEVVASSELGRGTEFRVYLPLLGEAAARPTLVTVRPPPAHGELILLVEDEDGVRQLARRILKSFGYRVTATASAEEALEFVEKHEGELHLLLSDVIMPSMNGPELAAKARALRPGLRVLLMSGYSDEVLVARGALPRGTDLLQKPFTPATLAERVRAVLAAPPSSGSAPPSSVAAGPSSSAQRGPSSSTRRGPPSRR